MIILVLIILGLCWGSFTNALIWRLHEQSLPKKKRKASGEKLSIAKGRSMCPNCGHVLSVKDLIPVLSWLTLRGRCRYCKKSISWQYPVVEVATATLFVASYYLWPRTIEGWEIGVFVAWLTCLVGFMGLIIYDLRWMLLPNKIIFPLYGAGIIYVILRAFAEHSVKPIGGAVAGVLIGGGIFYLIFVFSNGRWIGGGDVKLGFLLGGLSGGLLSAALMLFVASALGSLAALPLTLSGRIARNTRIPFGPFLIVGAILVQLFSSDFISWYIAHFIDV